MSESEHFFVIFKARLHFASIINSWCQHQRFHYIRSIGVATHFCGDSLGLLSNLSNLITVLTLTLNVNGLLRQLEFHK